MHTYRTCGLLKEILKYCMKIIVSAIFTQTHVLKTGSQDFFYRKSCCWKKLEHVKFRSNMITTRSHQQNQSGLRCWPQSPEFWHPHLTVIYMLGTKFDKASASAWRRMLKCLILTSAFNKQRIYADNKCLAGHWTQIYRQSLVKLV